MSFLRRLHLIWKTTDAAAQPAPRLLDVPEAAAVEPPTTRMTDEHLRALENAGVPTIGRLSDTLEALADEKQDRTTSLNFPLHWTSAKESWRYLFDIAIACELLAVRPDDRVLDFAAGTCWATELLGRLGVRTVSIDLSTEMMRRGRERLAADSRLIFRDDAAFVAARGQALPFAADTFDGVLCMNALHHLPSYGDAFRELHRVLKPGGRAVFSEPGTSHASQPLSQFRMREECIIEKSVSLPLVRRLALDAGFSRMRIVPLRSADTYSIDYVDSPRDAAELERIWSDTLLHSPREHARFVLSKGDDPPADTLLPADKLVGRLAAKIDLVDVAPRVPAESPVVDRLRIRNTGTVVWKRQGRRFGGQVTVGVKVCDDQDNVIREDLGRTWIPHDVAPGEEFPVDVTITGVLPAGRYQLRYDVVVEGVTWFEFQGSPCARRVLDVI
jgi:SAM-dependent methyltransferase